MLLAHPYPLMLCHCDTVAVGNFTARPEFVMLHFHGMWSAECKDDPTLFVFVARFAIALLGAFLQDRGVHRGQFSARMGTQWVRTRFPD